MAPHTALAAGRAFSAPLLAGDAGTEQTIALIRQAVQESLRNPQVRATAGQIVSRFDPQDIRGRAQALFSWVRHNIRFVHDPVGHETVSSASWTLTHGFGDCDDTNAVLLPSLLGVVGIPARLITVALDPRSQSFSHIYAEALVDGRWMPLDVARPHAAFGQVPPRYYQARRRTWPLFDPGDELSGLSGYNLGQFVLPQFRSPDWWQRIQETIPIVSRGISTARGIRVPRQPSEPADLRNGRGGVFDREFEVFGQEFKFTPTIALIGGALLLLVLRK